MRIFSQAPAIGAVKVKRQESVILLFILVFALSSVSFGKYSGGTGEPNAPYRIATAEDLNDIGNHTEDWDACFVLTNDVNLSAFTGTQFKIIGPNYITPFSGVFDGNGHTISNFTYDSNNAKRIGLFGFVGLGAEIRNLTMENVTVNDELGEVIGGLAGVNDGIISNCHVEGVVSGNNGIGGLVGVNPFGTISYCSAKGSVSGNDNSGGLTAWNDGIILYSYADCNVSGRNDIAGGLVGANWSGGTISNCYSTGAVDGNLSVGGLIGSIGLGTISNCYTTALVNGNKYVGGLAGESVATTFAGCFWNKDINPDLNGIGDAADPNVIGKSTAEMKKQSIFADAGWDMVNIWDIGENQTYPFLRTHPPSDINKDEETNFYDFAILAEHWLSQ
jgi:hypothetical protein